MTEYVPGYLFAETVTKNTLSNEIFSILHSNSHLQLHLNSQNRKKENSIGISCPKCKVFQLSLKIEPSL